MAGSPGDVHFLAIDPGDVHCGVAYLTARTLPAPVLFVHWTRDLRPDSHDDLLESASVDGWVVEAFRLYPELAREQGYSDFPTVQRIGVAKYIARRRSVWCDIQGADLKKKSRRIGERLCPSQGSIRTLGSGRSRYVGWDWNAPTQHERDAISHGAWWAFNSKRSPIYDSHLAKQPGRRAVVCL
jgi:hypothetical protein